MTVRIDFSNWDLPEPGAQPPDREIQCMLCRGTLKVAYRWMVNRWIHPTVHPQCAENFEKRLQTKKGALAEIPDRFRVWDHEKFPDKRALSVASAFDVSSSHSVLALVGLPGRAKSRLMWHIVQQFFESWANARRESRWVDYFLFVDLMTEYDQSKIIKLKTSPFAFVDDIGCTESFGRTRAQLQDAIRYRVQAQKWTFLTIDNQDFDQDLIKNVFRDRAVVVILDE